MPKTLSPEQIDALLLEHPAWSLEAERLVRTVTFATFPEAIAHVDRIAVLAEQANHHPDIDIRYNRVRFALISHDVAALSPRDAAMIRQIDEILHETLSVL